MRRLILSLALTCLPVTVAFAGDAKGTPKLYVTNSTGNTIHVIDLTTFKVLAQIKTGDRPHGAAAAADCRTLFTTVESDNTLLAIDTRSDKIIRSVKLSGMPNQCAVTPDGKYVGVPIRDRDLVDIVDVNQGRVVKSLPVKVPHNCYCAGRDDRIFVTSMGDHKVNLMDLTTLAYAAEIPVGGVPRPIAVTRDEKTLYCALSDLHGFVIADIPKRKVIEKVDLPPLPPGTKFPVERTPTHGLELSPDEKELWVTSCGTDMVYVYDTVRKHTVNKVGVGSGPNWVAFSPAGRYCCISNVLSDDVSIIDRAKRKEVARVKVGSGPKRLVAVDVPASPRPAPKNQTPGKLVRVLIETEKGAIEVELDAGRAPVTVANFLRYVDGKFYDGGRFHRTVKPDNQPENKVKIEVIQAGINPKRGKDEFAPIQLERTRDTRLSHRDGTISMARDGPDTATSDFFLCVGDQPELDFGGKRNPDGQGFAAFGKVIKGMDVVRNIQASPANGQALTPPIKILKITRRP